MQAEEAEKKERARYIIRGVWIHSFLSSDWHSEFGVGISFFTKKLKFILRLEIFL